MTTDKWIDDKIKEYKDEFSTSVNECYKNADKEIKSEQSEISHLLKEDVITYGQYDKLYRELDLWGDRYKYMCNIDVSGMELDCDSAYLINNKLSMLRVEAEESAKERGVPDYEDDLALGIFSAQEIVSTYDYICRKK